MGEPSIQNTVTGLLLQWSEGDPVAREALLPMVYAELRSMAQAILRREREGHTLQPTALVNELYLKLVDQRRVNFKDRKHFFGLAAHLMRRLLVDHSRRRNASKRGAGAVVSLSDELELPDLNAGLGVDLVDLHEALNKLEKVDERKCRIVELRYLVGFTTDETAEILGLSAATVERDWKFARSWLGRAIGAPLDQDTKA